MAVRVLRLMEYTYPDMKSAHDDMERWAVQSVMHWGPKSIRSSVILDPTPIEMSLPVTEEPTKDKYVKVMAGGLPIDIVRSAWVPCGELEPHDFHYWEARRGNAFKIPAGAYICAEEAK